MGRSVVESKRAEVVNLTVLKKTRRPPQTGDIFVMLPSDGQYVFGRVIASDAVVGPMSGCILIYIYRPRSRDKEVLPELRRDQLLVAPIMTNRLPWTRGYFEHVAHRELRAEDRLGQHCFMDSLGRFYDERSQRLDEATPPVGDWGLHSFWTISDEVSEALGLPPDAERQ